MINLREILENKDMGKELDVLECIVKIIMLDHDENKRKEVIDFLSREFSSDNVKMIGGFAGDNQIYLTLQNEDCEPEILYICDLPKEYSGKPVQKTYPFKMEGGLKY